MVLRSEIPYSLDARTLHLGEPSAANMHLNWTNGFRWLQNTTRAQRYLVIRKFFLVRKFSAFPEIRTLDLLRTRQEFFHCLNVHNFLTFYFSKHSGHTTWMSNQNYMSNIVWYSYLHLPVKHLKITIRNYPFGKKLVKVDHDPNFSFVKNEKVFKM